MLAVSEIAVLAREYKTAKDFFYIFNYFIPELSTLILPLVYCIVKKMLSRTTNRFRWNLKMGMVVYLPFLNKIGNDGKHVRLHYGN